MDQYAHLELQGEEREQFLAAVHRQISAWGLTMPQGAPLVSHFGLNRFPETGLTEFWVANELGAGYCGKFLFVCDGQTCPYHRHRVKHETFFVVKGRVRMNAEGRPRELSEGDLLVMPPGVGHSFTGLGPALLLEVSMPSVLQDNYFSDLSIGDDGVI